MFNRIITSNIWSLSPSRSNSPPSTLTRVNIHLSTMSSKVVKIPLFLLKRWFTRFLNNVATEIRNRMTFSLSGVLKNT